MLTSLMGGTLGLGAVVYMNAMRKARYFAKPWEHVIGFACGAYLLNKMSEMEAVYEVKVAEKLAEKIERNQGELEEKYKVVLGSDYSKWFPQKS